ncbi:hypothetical protein ACJX0J_037756, partial [Zea mays]
AIEIPGELYICKKRKGPEVYKIAYNEIHILFGASKIPLFVDIETFDLHAFEYNACCEYTILICACALTCGELSGVLEEHFCIQILMINVGSSERNRKEGRLIR